MTVPPDQRAQLDQLDLWVLLDNLAPADPAAQPPLVQSGQLVQPVQLTLADPQVQLVPTVPLDPMGQPAQSTILTAKRALQEMGKPVRRVQSDRSVNRA